ncbi:hypothetical protein [Candidatus Binatus sp.]|uniref:hypothetical protein n=1 Tax=Candidatus Binatus sp. TaxID=2811406 RepID=UPI00272C6F59|nr:hypothetical protein [Candidatus Binatus sp.]
METSQEQPTPRVRITPLTGVDFAKEVARGIGVSAGMALLWGLEIIRNACFRMLDRFNVPARRKRASAFPPGQPRKRQSA